MNRIDRVDRIVRAHLEKKADEKGNYEPPKTYHYFPDRMAVEGEDDLYDTRRSKLVVPPQVMEHELWDDELEGRHPTREELYHEVFSLVEV